MDLAKQEELAIGFAMHKNMSGILPSRRPENKREDMKS